MKKMMDKKRTAAQEKEAEVGTKREQKKMVNGKRIALQEKAVAWKYNVMEEEARTQKKEAAEESTMAQVKKETGKTKKGKAKAAGKLIAAALVGGMCFLTACGNELPEDELVDKGRAFEMQETGNDLQASNFPFPGKEKFVTLSELKDSVKELLGDNYWPEVDFTKEELESKTGITEDMYIDFLAEKQVLDSHIDTMIIIKAKEAYVGEVEAALENYRTSVIEENRSYPQNLCKAEASRMETIENYVCFVQLGADTTIVADQGQDEIIAYCLEENERALYVLEKGILE